MSSEEGKNRTGVSHRPYDEAFKRAAVAQWQSGVPASRVAEGLGITDREPARVAAAVRRGAGRVGCGDSRQAACRCAERAGVASGGAPVARPAPERDQPARHFKKSRRDFCRPKRERFAVIEAMEASYPVSDLCEALRRVARGLLLPGVNASRANGSAPTPSWARRSARALRATVAVPTAARGCTGRCAGRGTPAAGTGSPGSCGGEGLVGRVRGRRRPGTTDSDHLEPIAPNRLGQRETPVERPNEVWAADITYVPTGEGWLYLAGVLDLGSRRVVGWAMGESLETSLPMDALRMALRQRRPNALGCSTTPTAVASTPARRTASIWPPGT